LIPTGPDAKSKTHKKIHILKERKDMEKKKTCQECEKGHNLFYENLEKGETTLKQQMKIER
jgi:hypothetical protein